MTDILVDIGNTALKWSFLNSSSDTKAYLHESPIHLNNQIKHDLEPNKIKTAYVCSVASLELRKEFQQLIESLGGRVCWENSSEKFEGNFIVRNEYDHPRKLGADRWFGAIGAVSQYAGRSIILVQFGTATTVDFISFEDREYHFLGGRIAPGIDLMFKSLAERIPVLSVKAGRLKSFPKNTEDAVTTGIIESQIGLIRNAVEKLAELVGKENVEIVLTGGGIESYGQLHKCAIEHLHEAKVNTNLVLKGLELSIRKEK